MVWLRIPSINYQTYLTGGHSTTDKGDNSRKKDTPNVCRSSFRIGSNLVAARLILLLLVTVIVLLNTDMFNRAVILNGIHMGCAQFHEYGQTWRLDDAGFLPNTCSIVEMATTTAPAYGQPSANEWHAVHRTVLRDDGIKLPTGPANAGRSSLVFLAGHLVP
ncbi:Aste57867_17005 [Aphanomyces stellatus]|uniref:Aste57867_17005 protein n=1 Tax=Aphanomyces stellatus TaxID=120398 RepID=A0A485L9Z0_9STRA|nr:hypothetical protein As57867_016947 [Aphanomyces stellatus]VFT93766.1 Aste57867_17005 [Aphanomyces stellatus]